MREKISRTLLLALILATIADTTQAASDLWLHVTVDENDGAKVTVNLPLALAEKALPMLPLHEGMRWLHHNGRQGRFGMALEDVRELWSEVRDSPDMTFLTVENDGEKVRVWKEKNFVYVEVRDDAGEEKVDVRVPLAVVDALLAGDEIDFTAAIQALAEHGGGDLVSVQDRDDRVRVWIDETPESR